MRNIEKMKQEAKKTAKTLGHVMPQFQDFLHHDASFSDCQKCKARVIVGVNVETGKAVVSGDAVTLQCC